MVISSELDEDVQVLFVDKINIVQLSSYVTTLQPCKDKHINHWTPDSCRLESLTAVALWTLARGSLWRSDWLRQCLMMLVCNDGWHEMMLFICGRSTYLVFMAWHIRDVSLLRILPDVTERDVTKMHLWKVFKGRIQSKTFKISIWICRLNFWLCFVDWWCKVTKCHLSHQDLSNTIMI